jgi:hypothetical protein
MNKWEVDHPDNLTQEQKDEIQKALAMNGGRELLIWYQERLKHGYYLDKHDIHYLKVSEYLPLLENCQETELKGVKRLPSTIHLYRMEKCYQYCLKKGLKIEIPTEQHVGCFYITTGIDDPTKAAIYAKCGNALVEYRDKYLAMSTSARNTTLYGKDMHQLYKEGIHRTYGNEYMIGSSTEFKLHQTVTMIPTKLFLEMEF